MFSVLYSDGDVSYFILQKMFLTSANSEESNASMSERDMRQRRDILCDSRNADTDNLRSHQEFI